MRGIILGGGISGITTAISTGYPVFEAEDCPGGICRSYERSGYHFAYGGHWLFKADLIKGFLRDLVKTKRYCKDTAVVLNGIFKSPIQKEEEFRADPGSLKAWLHERFGAGLCRVFFDDFNRSYTDGLYAHVLPESEEKTPTPDKKGSYNEVFHYPTQGLSYLINEMALRCEFRPGKKAVAVDLRNKIVTFADGTQFSYDRMISTIPLREMLKIAGIQSGMLPFTSISILNIGAKRGKKCPTEQWIYIPRSRSKFFRVGIYSNIDATFAPKDRVGLYIERATQTHERFSNGYARKVVEELQEWGWIGDAEILSERWIKYGYTWRYPRSPIDGYLELLRRNGVESLGRYAEWRFMGMAECIKAGLEVKK